MRRDRNVTAVKQELEKRAAGTNQAVKLTKNMTIVDMVKACLLYTSDAADEL